MKTDTIAAISTAMSNSGIGIVRMSGEDAFTIIDKIYKSKDGKKILSKVKSHTVHYGFIEDEDKMIDEVMVLIMKGPNTYTREDTVEIDCHGGVLVMKNILKTLLKYGARIAEPGEFTKRAFLNGRIDLSQAEAVMDLINSKNDFALKASVNQLNGNVSKKIIRLRDEIIYQIAFIESALDDPEHISLEGYSQQLSLIVDKIAEELQELLIASENGKVLTEGIKTVILGKPNVGKSSLLNILVGEERAIVTDIAGTTRDILTENILINGISFNVIDTAGIRDTTDIVEEIGVKKARNNAEDADLIIYVVDSSTALDENDEKIIDLIKDKKAIILLNKTDLEKLTSIENINLITDKKVIPISAVNGSGIKDFEECISSMFLQGNINYNDQLFITNMRHKESIEEANDSIIMVKKSIEDNMPEDFYTIDLINAYEQLGFIIGESVGEDLVNEIFSKFCMGK